MAKPFGIKWVAYKLACGHYGYGSKLAIYVHCDECNALVSVIKK